MIKGIEINHIKYGIGVIEDYDLNYYNIRFHQQIKYIPYGEIGSTFFVSISDYQVINCHEYIIKSLSSNKKNISEINNIRKIEEFLEEYNKNINYEICTNKRCSQKILAIKRIRFNFLIDIKKYFRDEDLLETISNLYKEKFELIIKNIIEADRSNTFNNIFNEIISNKEQSSLLKIEKLQGLYSNFRDIKDSERNRINDEICRELDKPPYNDKFIWLIWDRRYYVDDSKKYENKVYVDYYYDNYYEEEERERNIVILKSEDLSGGKQKLVVFDIITGSLFYLYSLNHIKAKRYDVIKLMVKKHNNILITESKNTVLSLGKTKFLSLINKYEDSYKIYNSKKQIIYSFSEVKEYECFMKIGETKLFLVYFRGTEIRKYKSNIGIKYQIKMDDIFVNLDSSIVNEIESDKLNYFMGYAIIAANKFNSTTKYTTIDFINKRITREKYNEIVSKYKNKRNLIKPTIERVYNYEDEEEFDYSIDDYEIEFEFIGGIYEGDYKLYEQEDEILYEELRGIDEEDIECQFGVYSTEIDRDIESDIRGYEYMEEYYEEIDYWSWREEEHYQKQYYDECDREYREFEVYLVEDREDDRFALSFEKIKRKNKKNKDKEYNGKYDFYYKTIEEDMVDFIEEY